MLWLPKGYRLFTRQFTLKAKVQATTYATRSRLRPINAVNYKTKAAKAIKMLHLKIKAEIEDNKL